MKNIYLLRHAQTEWNQEKKIQGRMNSPLTSQGQKQAREWGQHLLPYNIDLILASPQERVVESVNYINASLQKKVLYKEGFREQDWGEWEGLTVSQINENSPGELKKRTSLGWDFAAPKGEKRLSVWQRAHDELVASLQNTQQENILLVCHQGVIKALLYKILKRHFLPSEKKILQKDNLHHLTLNQDDTSFHIAGLNLIPDLNPKKKI